QNYLTTNYNVTDFLSRKSALTGKTVRVGGEVLPGALRNVSQSTLTFTIMDKTQPANVLSVIYQGSSVPDTFKEGQDIIVEGKFTGGTFQASNLIMKCPSKYTVATATVTK
ncbi:MAG: cytochrome c maturation protein CcmE, partial [Dehalococcoidales bacterium]|nr:cytochrome c maturation protein CcmE [Dehalococcoidales bacterium]